MLTRLNNVYIRGVGFQGQLGLNNSYQSAEQFVPIPNLQNIKIKDIKASWAQTALLREDGHMLAWGWPLDVRSQLQVLWLLQNQTALAKFIQKYSPFPKISIREGAEVPEYLSGFVSPVVNFSYGGGFMAACDEDGRAYTWGSNLRGQLGTSDIDYRFQPTIVESLLDEHVVEVCGGFQHTLFRTKSGNVYGTGRSQYCSYGVMPISQVKIFGYVNEPMVIDIDKIISVAAGHFHSLFLTSSGEVYACGKNVNGQCGQIYHKDMIESPTKIYFPESITQIACGLKHSVALGLSGTLYAWGCKIYGQVDGFRGGMDEEQCSPQVIKLPSTYKITEIYAAFNRTAVRLESGEVWIWGGEDHRKLGGEYYESITLLNNELPEGKDEEIYKIGLGYMHTVIASIT